VEESLINETGQYVILGAGYDTRAHRLDFPNPLRVFEVDQPEVQERKRKKLPDKLLGNECVVYVPVDFSYQSLSERLIGSGFDSGKPTIITLEGVSQYISKEDFIALVQEINSLTKNADVTFFVSYIDELFTTNPEECCGVGFEKAGEKFELVRALSAKTGEPWISFYTDTEIQKIFTVNGFTVEETTTLANLNSRYFTPVGRTVPDSQLFNLERFVVAKKSCD
jgi:methyltransferase (TIGR00027 family)